jgi:hypothetical protein
MSQNLFSLLPRLKGTTGFITQDMEELRAIAKETQKVSEQLETAMVTLRVAQAKKRLQHVQSKLKRMQSTTGMSTCDPQPIISEPNDDLRKATKILRTQLTRTAGGFMSFDELQSLFQPTRLSAEALETFLTAQGFRKTLLQRLVVGFVGLVTQSSDGMSSESEGDDIDDYSQ